MTRYILGTSVPDHWRPFVPVHVPGSVRSIRLQRARMPGPLREPKAEILKVEDANKHYFIEEEEVPRAGRIVQRVVPARAVARRQDAFCGWDDVLRRDEAKDPADWPSITSSNAANATSSE